MGGKARGRRHGNLSSRPGSRHQELLTGSSSSLLPPVRSVTVLQHVMLHPSTTQLYRNSSSFQHAAFGAEGKPQPHRALLAHPPAPRFPALRPAVTARPGARLASAHRYWNTLARHSVRAVPSQAFAPCFYLRQHSPAFSLSARGAERSARSDHEPPQPTSAAGRAAERGSFTTRGAGGRRAARAAIGWGRQDSRPRAHTPHRSPF